MLLNFFKNLSRLQIIMFFHFLALVFLVIVVVVLFFYFVDNIIALSLLTLVPLLISIAFFTLAERKVMGGIQRRVGPNRVGFWGVLQPFADGLKLIIKEIIIPSRAKRGIFFLSPFLALFLSFIGWIVIPFNTNVFVLNISCSLIYLFTVSSLNVYVVFLAGWASNSKYALLGSLRSITQVISYELLLSMIFLPIILVSGSMNINTIIYKQSIYGSFIFLFFPLFIALFIVLLAETNRVPFDLPEAEAELVAGYNVEFSGILFASFFLGEYSNILLMSSLFVILFLGGMFNFSFKVVVTAFFFILVRSTLPRYRYDQLMVLCWESLLPLVFSIIMFSISILFFIDGFVFSLQYPFFFNKFQYIYIS